MHSFWQLAKKKEHKILPLSFKTRWTPVNQYYYYICIYCTDICNNSMSYLPIMPIPHHKGITTTHVIIHLLEISSGLSQLVLLTTNVYMFNQPCDFIMIYYITHLDTITNTPAIPNQYVIRH